MGACSTPILSAFTERIHQDTYVIRMCSPAQAVGLFVHDTERGCSSWSCWLETPRARTARAKAHAHTLELNETIVVKHDQTPLFPSFRRLVSVKCLEILFHCINFQGQCWHRPGAFHSLYMLSRITDVSSLHRYRSQVLKVKFTAQTFNFPILDFHDLLLTNSHVVW